MKQHLPLPTSSRSAHAAIAGYEYQFDNTALKILDASSTDVVDIEGIEDIDIHTPHNSEAVQVKYFSGQSYVSPKSLRKPVRLMLDHHKTGVRWNYSLHIHFGDFGDMPDRFNVAQLKNGLTLKQRDGKTVKYFAGVTNSDLNDFCSRLRLIRGDDIATQQSKLIEALRNAMNCDRDEVEAIYIAKAREFVHERAKNGDSSVRRVSRQELIDWLTVKEFLFDKWQIQRIGVDRYLAAQKRKLRSGGFHDPTRKRAIYLEISRDNLDQAMMLCEALASKHLGRLKSAHPWTAIIGGTPDLVRELKVGLVRSEVAYNDGHEDLEFQPQAFIEPPVINTRGTGDKIDRSSFILRLITRDSFQRLDPSAFKISRFVSIGDKQDLMNNVTDHVFALRNFEPAAYRQLLEEIA